MWPGRLLNMLHIWFHHEAREQEEEVHYRASMHFSTSLRLDLLVCTLRAQGSSRSVFVRSEAGEHVVRPSACWPGFCLCSPNLAQACCHRSCGEAREASCDALLLCLAKRPRFESRPLRPGTWWNEPPTGPTNGLEILIMWTWI